MSGFDECLETRSCMWTSKNPRLECTRHRNEDALPSFSSQVWHGGIVSFPYFTLRLVGILLRPGAISSAAPMVFIKPLRLISLQIAKLNMPTMILFTTQPSCLRVEWYCRRCCPVRAQCKILLSCNLCAILTVPFMHLYACGFISSNLQNSSAPSPVTRYSLGFSHLFGSSRDFFTDKAACSFRVSDTSQCRLQPCAYKHTNWPFAKWCLLFTSRTAIVWNRYEEMRILDICSTYFGMDCLSILRLSAFVRQMIHSLAAGLLRLSSPQPSWPTTRPLSQIKVYVSVK
jgi:hypothetical protein